MILCLDVGNSQIHGGVFDEGESVLQFRTKTRGGSSSDELGLFLRAVLKENKIDPDRVMDISLCSVVPEMLHSLKNCCKKYFEISPFVLEPAVRTGLTINYHNPLEVGSDRIANAIAAGSIFPGKNIIIVDFGTATTFCALSATNEYLGGVIIAGLKISMQTLEANTSKLPSVEIVVPDRILGKSTIESIQSGLYFGALGTLREVIERLTQEVFKNQRPMVIGTGGMASLFKTEKIFDKEIPDLVLKGLYIALRMNL